MTQKVQAVFKQQPGKSRYEITAMIERKNGEDLDTGNAAII